MYLDNVDFLGDIEMEVRNVEILIEAAKEVQLSLTQEKTKYMVTSRN